MGVTEIVNAAVGPANKLIDAVTSAIGKAYEPKYVRKMAEAKAYEIKVIGEELRNNADLPIVYDSTGSISADISDFEALTKRAGKRIAYREVAKQENIEAIVDAAYESLQDLTEATEGEVSKEWMNRFIDAAGDISTDELRLLWSKVLAGEVKKPSTFSLRTLECLKNLDASDARLFEKICSVIVSNRHLINDDDFLKNYGVCYSDILKLDECGLINSSGTISFLVKLSSSPALICDFGKYVLMAKSEKERNYALQQFPLTAAGRELSYIVEVNQEFKFVRDVYHLINNKNKDKEVVFSIHRVVFRSQDGFKYEEKPIDPDTYHETTIG